MKTLNRPMFRYGGPIKEGVMNGIREPKRNGGSMANNEGPRRAALVGNPIYPKVDGRTNHIAPLAIGAAAMRFLPAAYRGFKASRAYKPFSQNLGFMGRLKDTLLPSRGIRAGMADPGAKQGFATGSLLRSNPGITLTAGGYGINKLLGKEPKPEPGKPSLINQRKAKIGMPENLTIVDGGQFEKPAKELTEAERIELENKARREKMDSYRKIMDIKGMSKDAAYKSLIDASKIIQEGGNLKKQLKDGSLIQKVTAAASKRFDKVSDTETALRSLVAKGEIQKEMDKDKNALDREYKQGVIDMNKKKMSGPTLLESIRDYVSKNKKPPANNNLATLIVSNGGLVEEVVDPSLVDKHIKGGGDSVSFMELVVKSNLEKGKEVTPGTYVVKDSIVVVDENGNVSSPYKIT
jgi:hypothetical protein